MTDFSKLPPECDELCRYRKCFRHGEDKGTFVPGRGYTSYHKKPIHVCMTRHLNGCDTTFDGKRPEPDWDKIRNEIMSSRCSKKLKNLMLEIIKDINK